MALTYQSDVQELLNASRVIFGQRPDYAVRSATTAAPPTTPVLNDMWLLPAAPTGAWAGRAGSIAQWDGAAWQFIAPTAGMSAFAIDTSQRWSRSSTAWSMMPTSVSALGVSGNIGDAVAGTIADARLPSRLQSANNIATDIASSFGGYVVAATDWDYNAAPEGFRGLVAVAANKLNQPPSITSVFFWFLECQRMYTGGSGVAIRQIATAHLGAVTPFPFQFMRISNTSGVWSPWRPVLGQSGANALGGWSQYPDGSMICYGRLSQVVDVTTAQGSSIFRSASQTISFPASFAAAPAIAYSCFYGANAGMWSGWASTQAASSSFYLFGTQSFPAASVTIQFIANGRWY